MPGFVAGTGGVPKEGWLTRTRDTFQASAPARAEYWHRLGLPSELADEIRISLFSYESPAIESLFQAWAEGSEPVRCLVPEGRSLADVARFFGRSSLAPDTALSRGALTAHIIPMQNQDGYDRLLWACDCNFVRGEDSFVRAMWAGKPLVWQAYRQDDGAHWPKIATFLDRYCIGLDSEDTQALRRLWQAWNEDGDAGSAWVPFWSHRQRWLDHSVTWQARLDEVGDLAANLVKFCNEKIN
jgi:uncharacterized repeat protein (TIGR03837 family)